MKDWETAFQAISSGDREALSHLLTRIESGEDSPEFYSRLYQAAPQVYSVTVAGPGGAGKSSLIAQWAGLLARHQYLGVIAMDPRSEVSSGSFLGDRIRMGPVARHPRIFIRSFAPREPLFSGFLAAKAMSRAFGLAGFGCVVFETTGTGQQDWLVPKLGDTTVWVLSPESGDEIQMMKRGLIEYADIIVINKCDRPGARQIETAVQRELHSRAGQENWKRPVFLMSSLNGEGVDALTEAVERHHEYLKASGRIDENRRAAHRKECLLWSLTIFWERLNRAVSSHKELDENSYRAGRKILKEVLNE